MQFQNKDDMQEIAKDAHKEVAEGLLYIHTRINASTAKIIEMLSEKELIAIEQLNERKNQVAERLVMKFVESGIGLLYQDSEDDNQTVRGNR